MFKCDRGVCFAIGLVAGVAIAILITGISIPNPFTNYPKYHECSDGDCSQYTNQYPPISFADRIWDLSISTPKDTLAQWSMAVFAFVATGASILAVLLLKSTLASTNKTLRAASDANSIMREEMRPWLAIKTKLKGHFSCEEVGGDTVCLQVNCGLHFDVINKGRTPAFNYAIHSHVICTDNWLSIDDDFEGFIGTVRSRERGWTNGVLFPDDSSQLFPLDHQEMIKRATPTSSNFTLLVAATYTDSGGTLKGMDARAYALQQETPNIGPWIQEFRLNPKFIKME